MMSLVWWQNRTVSAPQSVPGQNMMKLCSILLMHSDWIWSFLSFLQLHMDKSYQCSCYRNDTDDCSDTKCKCAISLTHTRYYRHFLMEAVISLIYKWNYVTHNSLHGHCKYLAFYRVCPSAIKTDVRSTPLRWRHWSYTVRNKDHFILIIHVMNNGMCIIT